MPKIQPEYDKYWVIKDKEWHSYEVGEYHVSSIGTKKTGEPKKHYGPCLRQTFYEYKYPLEDNVFSKGNKNTGKRIHEDLQVIYKRNNPNSIIEFPLYEEITEELKLCGSIDVVHFFYKDGQQWADIIDFKTAMYLTLPKDEEAYNPTYVYQLYIYAHWLTQIMNVKIRHLLIVYIDKVNEVVYEQKPIVYNPDIGGQAWDEFKRRSIYEHDCLTSDTLPIKEPMRWCKLCKYRMKCDLNIKSNEEIKQFSEKRLQEVFEVSYEKKAIWAGKETKGYIKWKGEIKDE